MSADDLYKLKIEKKGGPVRRQGLRRKLLLTAFFVVIVVAVLAGFLRKPVMVQTAGVSKTYPSQNVTLLNASGYVVAQRKAAVSAKVTSRLEWLGVQEGSRVHAGEVIARLERQDVIAGRDQAHGNLSAARAGIEQARAELDDANLAFNRLKDLYAQGVVSKADYDAAEARLRKARAGLRSAEFSIKALTAALRGAENAIEYTSVRAPFDGVVLTKNADVGDIVTPLGAAANAKAAVVTMADLASLQVEADVSEASLAKIKVGGPCEIQIDALPDRRIPGIVATIVPTADRSKATVLVKVKFLRTEPGLLPEMSAKVAFLERPVTQEEAQAVTTVPMGVVVTSAGGSWVYIVRDGIALRTAIRTGRKIGDQLEVVSGVRAGDRLVLSPLDRMKDRLRVAQADK